MVNDPPQSDVGFRKWVPWLMIILAGALSHLWCLGSQFYMDDWMGILDNPLVTNGRFWEAGLMNGWTTFGYVVQHRCFGFSPVGFHAVNWCLHVSVACVLYGFGREFLRDRLPAGVAWFAALLFVVHPLASEIPNYARTQDLAWATLFSLCAAWSVLLWIRSGDWKWWIGVVLGIAGATASKGPGLFHALMMTGGVGLVCMERVKWEWIRRRWLWFLLLCMSGVGVLWFSGTAGRLVNATEFWKEPRFVGHAYTLSRVFWEFAWRSFWPTSLCSDHHIAETLIPSGCAWWNLPDKGAMFAMGSMLILMAISVWMCFTRPMRLFGLCLALYTATILFRMLYLVPEFMPEYRIYPGLPWFCLGGAIALGVGWRRLAGKSSAVIPAFVLLAVLAVISARRSFVWHDLETLTADVLRQYPAQARALWEMQDHDSKKENWERVIHRQQTGWMPVFQAFLNENRRLSPARELPSGHFALADVGCKSRYVVAVAHVRGMAAGMAELKGMENYMRHYRMDQAVHWSHYHTAKIRLLAMAGKYREAMEIIRDPENGHWLSIQELRQIEGAAGSQAASATGSR